MASTIYARAKAELERRGWYQGYFVEDTCRRDDCAVCLAGAVLAACHGDPIASISDCVDGGCRRALGALRERIGVVGNWNDHPRRTAVQVFALLDEMDRREREAVG